MRVFNSYLQLCSLSYWGPSGGPAGPKMGGAGEVDTAVNATINGPNKTETGMGGTVVSQQ